MQIKPIKTNLLYYLSPIFHSAPSLPYVCNSCFHRGNREASAILLNRSPIQHQLGALNNRNKPPIATLLYCSTNYKLKPNPQQYSLHQFCTSEHIFHYLKKMETHSREQLYYLNRKPNCNQNPLQRLCEPHEPPLKSCSLDT